MDYKCPQCGKVIVLSAEELMAQGNLVVCPQCLSEFVGDANAPVSRPDAEKYNYGCQNGAELPVSQTNVGNKVRCRYCGANIDKDCNFCPKCGGKQIVQQYHRAPSSQQSGFAKTPEQSKKNVAQNQSPNVPFVPRYRYGYKNNTRHKVKRRASFWAYVIMLLIISLFIVFVINR